MSRQESHLVLSDGTVFEGYAAGYIPESGFTTGEFVFNTALSGYQEVITDPSYAGQIISFTYPHIGNYGVTPLDDEALTKIGVISEPIPIPTPAIPRAKANPDRPASGLLDAW